MPRKKYEYKHIESVNTLRLPLNFRKLDLLPIVQEAYYILSTKEKKKAAYIQKAIEHYDAFKMEEEPVKRTLQRIRIAHKAKELFDIQSEADAKKLLSISLDSDDYQAITGRIPTPTNPAKMLCGFKVDNKESIELHERLYNLSANERILLVSNAIVNYVLDGMDPEMKEVLATKFIIAAINEYNHISDKESTLKHFITVLNLN